MKKTIQNHYLKYGMYTNPGLYEDYVKNDLPDDIQAIGKLLRQNIIHRTTLVAGNTGTNADLRFGDMKKIPWWRQPEDDMLVTASAMLAELFRRDAKGLHAKRKEEDKLILTCRYVSILMASILKAKGIPCRVRSGHADYFDMGDLGDVTTDHWINQYWSAEEKRWIAIDVDGSWSMDDSEVNPYDLQEGDFDFPAQAWLDIRAGKVKPRHFYNAGHVYGAVTVGWALFYDFHSLMNNEIHYMHGSVLADARTFKKLPESKLKKIDRLARLMRKPDENFEKLQKLYSSDKEYRLLVGSLM